MITPYIQQTGVHIIHPVGTVGQSLWTHHTYSRYCWTVTANKPYVQLSSPPLYTCNVLLNSHCGHTIHIAGTTDSHCGHTIHRWCGYCLIVTVITPYIQQASPPLCIHNTYSGYWWAVTVDTPYIQLVLLTVTVDTQ